MDHKKLRKFITRKGLFARIPLTPDCKDIEPEINLGRDVLDRILLDSLTDPEEHEDWFDEANEDFVTICYIANLEPEKVVNIFKRVTTEMTREKDKNE